MSEFMLVENDIQSGAVGINPEAIASVQQVHVAGNTRLEVTMIHGQKFMLAGAFSEFMCKAGNVLYARQRLVRLAAKATERTL